MSQKSSLAKWIGGALGAVVLFGATGVVANDWDRVGTVRFTALDHIANEGALFEGAMDRIGFRAVDRPVRCDMIRINFLNGGDQEIRNRRFGEDRRVVFDLQGGDRHITHIHFNCHPVGRGRGSARIHISGRN